MTGLGTDDTSPHGTAFPQSLGMAATFDPSLVQRVMAAIANEIRGQNNLDLAVRARVRVGRPSGPQQSTLGGLACPPRFRTTTMPTTMASAAGPPS